MILSETPWVNSLIELALTILTGLVGWYLKNKAQEAAANAARAQMDRQAQLMARVKSFLWGTAAAIAEKRFPNLARAVVRKELTTAYQIKSELVGWGYDLRLEAISYFRTQGVDLVQEIGLEFIDKLIERAANDVSPLPGQPTSQTLLRDGVATKLLEEGLQAFKKSC